MPIDVSSYKLNQTKPTNPLELLTNVGKAADSLGGLAIGRAMQGAVNPETGEIDQSQLLQRLTRSPIGAARAVPVLDALQKLKQAGFATDQAGLETLQKRMAITNHLFSGLASRDKPTGADVHDVAVKALNPALGADKAGITMPVIMATIKQFKDKDGNWLPPDQIRKKALELQTQAASTAEILAQHSPQHQVFDRGGQLVVAPMGTKANPKIGLVVTKTLPPTTTVATPEGARYIGEQPSRAGAGIIDPDVQDEPLGDVPLGGGTMAPQAVAPAGPAATLAPGQPEAMAAVAQQGAAMANELSRAYDTSMTRKALLSNMEDLLRKFTPGAKADWTLFAKNFANRNLPVPDAWKKDGAVFDPKSIASQEEFNKQAMQLAQQQFATIGGTGTDAKFSSAFETSPNELLSSLGNKGIIRLLKGNEDAIQAKNHAWRTYAKAHNNNPGTYADFSLQFNDHFDPRVFQFKYIDPKERQDYIDHMSPDERLKFLTDLTYARKQGWVSFAQPKK